MSLSRREWYFFFTSDVDVGVNVKNFPEIEVESGVGVVSFPTLDSESNRFKYRTRLGSRVGVEWV